MAATLVPRFDDATLGRPISIHGAADLLPTAEYAHKAGFGKLGRNSKDLHIQGPKYDNDVTALKSIAHSALGMTIATY